MTDKKKMTQFLGVKLVSAMPMTRGEYCKYRGWEIPKDEDAEDTGYLIEYPPHPSSTPNHKDHEGYISWSPDAVFADSYTPVTDLPFSYALEMVKNQGARAARKGWNGKGMFIFLVPGSRFTVNREPLLSILGEGTEVNYHGHIDMKTADGQIVPWLASQTDILANDWQLV